MGRAGRYPRRAPRASPVSRGVEWLTLAAVALWALLAWSEAMAGPEAPCLEPVQSWPVEVGERTCGEWRCLTRPEWARQVVALEAEATRCALDLRTERTLSDRWRRTSEVATRQATEARLELQRERRRRWAWVAIGAAAGMALAGGTVYAGVRIVEAR